MQLLPQPRNNKKIPLKESNAFRLAPYSEMKSTEENDADITSNVKPVSYPKIRAASALEDSTMPGMLKIFQRWADASVVIKGQAVQRATKK